LAVVAGAVAGAVAAGLASAFFSSFLAGAWAKAVAATNVVAIKVANNFIMFPFVNAEFSLLYIQRRSPRTR
jgi:hypothetical protein